MILSIKSQAQLFLLCVSLGFLIGFVYDIFRIIRKIFKHPDFLTQIEDLIFWLLVSFAMFYFLLNENFAEIRLFTVLGALIGMAVYFLTISVLVIKVSMTVTHFIEKVLKTVLFIITFPIRIILRILSVPYGFLLHEFKIFNNNLKKHLKKSQRYAKIQKDKMFRDVKIIFKKK